MSKSMTTASPPDRYQTGHREGYTEGYWDGYRDGGKHGYRAGQRANLAARPAAPCYHLWQYRPHGICNSPPAADHAIRFAACYPSAAAAEQAQQQMAPPVVYFILPCLPDCTCTQRIGHPGTG